jgi:hypothetical protein
VRDVPQRSDPVQNGLRQGGPAGRRA